MLYVVAVQNTGWYLFCFFIIVPTYVRDNTNDILLGSVVDTNSSPCTGQNTGYRHCCDSNSVRKLLNYYVKIA